MGPHRLSQVANVAIIVPPRARMGSVGQLLDSLEMVRSHVQQQYGAIDILPASDRFGVVEVRLLGCAQGSVRTEGGVLLETVGMLDAASYDVIMVADHVPMEQVSLVELMPWLRLQADRGSMIAASGTGVEVLAACGLLDNRRAAAPLWLVGELQSRFPAVCFEEGARVVRDRDMITCVGGAAEAELAVMVVEAIASRNTALWLARRLSLPETEPEIAGPDVLLVRAQNWLAERFSQPVRIDDLARAMEVNRRTLHRHFVRGLGMGPVEYLQHLRLEAAKRMLERTPFTIDRIAALVGYTDTGYFRFAFRRATGINPRGWRSQSHTAA